MDNPITTIGLCAGVGWLDEGVRAGLEYFGFQHRTACYCEWEAYAASVLLARMEDKSLEPTPVWCGDLGDFDGRPFRGAVDGIVAGFPCQPWSNAGQRKGIDDARWLWPAIVRVIADVGPGFVFLENVSALIAGGGLEHVLSDLATLGFDAEWCCLAAEAVGASHRRDRMFILAYSSRFRERKQDHETVTISWKQTRETSGRGSQNQKNIASTAIQWGTPIARDHKDGTSADADVPTNGLLGRQVIRCLHPDPDPTGAESPKPSGRRLNPAFVCWLMGSPWWWTRAEPISFGAAETELWRCKLQSRLLSLCGELREQAREVIQ